MALNHSNHFHLEPGLQQKTSSSVNMGSISLFIFSLLLIACAHGGPHPAVEAPPNTPAPEVKETETTTQKKPRVVVHLGGTKAPGTTVAPTPNAAQTSKESKGNCEPVNEGCERVDINTAVSEDLVTLPGIGPSKAAAIVSYRDNNGRFTSVDNLTNVPGIGSITLEKLRPFLVAGESVAPPSKTASSKESTKSSSDEPRVNINTSDENTLTTLKGVGPKTAARIVAYREMHGPFLSKQALTEVKGIGAKTLEKLRSRIEVIVDINKASAEDFAALGFKNGSKIVQRRSKRGKFKNPSKLRKIPGTDKKLLKRLSDILQ